MKGRCICSLFRIITAVSILSISLSPGYTKELDCNGLLKLKLPDGRVTAAEIVAEGKFTPPETGLTLTNLPGFCRVAVTVEPAINIEVWLPGEDWNGKFNGVGLMGYTGAINYNALAPPLRRGYATASTDGGHKSGPRETRWAINNPEAIISLGHRAHHEMTIQARAVIKAYYGIDPKFSYFTGCSAGGWQSLTEAQRYPGDYDGIVSGGPVFNLVHLHAGSLWNAIQAREIKPEKFKLRSYMIYSVRHALEPPLIVFIQDVYRFFDIQFFPNLLR